MKIYGEIVIGQSEYGDLITAEIKDDKIRGFNDYQFIHKDNSADNNYYLVNWGWSHSVEVNGITYESGMKIDENLEPFFENEELKELIENDDVYVTNGSFCEKCGTFHDTDDYSRTYVITDHGGFYCKGCCPVGELMVEVNEVDDIYNSKDIVGMDMESEGFKEVETIFHDCGWGGPATNHTQATKIVDELVAEHGTLYAGLTGIGQFQVYVTLYKKVS